MIILLNAPPGAGKDTVGAAIRDRIYDVAEIVKFAQPLKDAARFLYCNDDAELFDSYDKHQDKKNEKCDQFYGASCREVQIGISELLFKPLHGSQVFGKILARKIKEMEEYTEVFIVTDSGFAPEAEVLVKEFGADQILLVRLHREGHTYDGDSRSYINLDHLHVKSIDIDNIEGHPNLVAEKILGVIYA